MEHKNWVPVDAGSKLWYRKEISAVAKSVTSADEKRYFIDPHIASRVTGNIVALVDDAVNTGGSMAAGVKALRLAGATRVIVAPFFTEGYNWIGPLAETGVDPNRDIVSIGHLPVFTPQEDGSYKIIPGT
jgi:adenine/guanine phosphoribosyltransferase-like PRPP-binding protein